MTTRPLAAIDPVRPVLAHELVLEQINTVLALGRLRAGDSLPRERDLAEMLGVSRATVREAIVVLANQGIVDVRRGRNGGIFINERPIDEKARRKLLRENRARLHETFEYRSVIETAGARHAAERRDEAQLATLAGQLQAMQDIEDRLGQPELTDKETTKLVAEFLAIDNEYHLAIARASGNSWIEKATLATRIEMFRPVGAIFYRLEPNSNHLHAQIYAAIAEQDPDAASAAMQAHITGTQTDIEAWLDN